MVNDNIIGRKRPSGYDAWNGTMDQTAGVSPTEFGAYSCNEEVVERFARSLNGEEVRPSLLIAPSRLGSGVLRAQIPDNLAFTVTNGTTPDVNGSTRVGPDGLIEVAKTNLVLRSEEFNVSGTWSRVSGGTGLLPVVTANAVVAPDGTTTAESIVFDRNAVSGSANFSQIQQVVSLATSGTYTLSVYAKATTSGDVGKGFYIRAKNNLVSGALTSSWVRYTSTETGVASGNTNVIIGNRGDFTPDSSVSVDLWGAQLEVGSTASEYIPTTTVARTRFAGVDVNSNVNTNAPRLDYLGQSCPALLVEASGTNLALQSAGFQVSGNWAPTNISVSTGTTAAFTAPDGSTDADLLTSTSSSSCNIEQVISFASGTYTISVFGKAGTSHILSLGNIARSARGAWFNLNAGAVTGTVNGGTASMQNYGNGWYRCIYTSSGMVSGSNIVSLSDAANGTTATSGTNLYVWGAQLETGSVATTYIPTTTAAVTRNADVISASGVSGLIGQQEGTVYWEGAIQRLDRVIFSLASGTSTTNTILLQTLSNGFFRADSLVNDTLTCQISSLAVAIIGQFYKIAFAYKENDFAFYINGVQQGLDTSGALPTNLNNAIFARGNSSLINDQRCRAVALYTTRLSNEQLMLLTSPTYYGDISDMSWANYLQRSGESVPSCLQIRNYQLLQV